LSDFAIDKAKFWFSRAAAEGHEPAMREMKKYA
jgi:TPR repeat protein